MLISTHTALINHVRGVLKSFGARVGPKGAAYFHGWVEDQIPEELRDALRPLLTAVGEQIALLDKEIERLAAEVYPETALLRQVDRVGLHTSIRFALTVEAPARIEDSRDVGAYFGLCPRRQQSGARDPELRITKTGDREMRRHLVQCAQQMLGPSGKDSDLRRWGLALLPHKASSRPGAFARYLGPWELVSAQRPAPGHVSPCTIPCSPSPSWPPPASPRPGPSPIVAHSAAATCLV